MIICLPSPFKGGQLVLRHINHNSSTAPITKTYDWSSSQDAMPQDLQWAAFYADTGGGRASQGRRIAEAERASACERWGDSVSTVHPGCNTACARTALVRRMHTPGNASKLIPSNVGEQFVWVCIERLLPLWRLRICLSPAASAEHEVLPVTEGHRITLTYNLRAVHKQQWPAPSTQPKKDEKGNKAGSGTTNVQSGDWMTPGDMSASAELWAELKMLLGDREWHNKGEALDSTCINQAIPAAMRCDH